MKKSSLQLSLISSVFITLFACSEQEQTITVIKQEKQPVLDVIGVNDDANLIPLAQIISEANNEFFKARPQLASQVAAKQSAVGHYYFNKLDNYDSADDLLFRNFMAAKSQQMLEHEASDDMLTEDNRLILANIYSYYAGKKDFPVGFIDSYFGHQPFIINQINGPLIDSISVLINNHKIENVKDAKDFIERLNAFVVQTKQVHEKFIADASNGWVPPLAILNSAHSYVSNYTQINIDKNSLVSHFQDNVSNIAGIDLAEQKQLSSDVKHIVGNDLYPSFNRIADTLTAYKDKAAKGDGIWAQPDGDKFYQYAIKTHGDSNLSAQEIHQLGLAEVARISADMDSILSQLGYEHGSVAKRMNALAKEVRFSYEDSKQGKEQLIADLNQQIADINKVIGSQFKTPIPYDVTVKAFPKEVEETSAGGQYSPPNLDGSKPGVFWINLREMSSITKFDMPTLTFHETNPGHHWQISLNMAQQFPLLRKLAPYNAYVEGWALYSEQVAYEMGMYKKDPYGNLGRLKAELFRAARLVVDSGLHHKRWSREQAIQYMMDVTGNSHVEVKAEIERYMVWPGQALGYKLGMLKILELREQSKKLLKDKFDIGEFHDVVLLNGAMPLTLLEQKVNEWIASK
ncbi:DUF885 domain-containing protein [Thalassomonas sp. M1454]|uniref:DUF885 domain-containing protein n=1 Tax=Thalassomonas sp. M1454 TaxID=2594477 RepID=UPI00163D4802|nr:DUF885 domain-containing protein [Thalassomonas sp. M1454]